MEINTIVKVNLDYNEQNLFTSFLNMLYLWEAQVEKADNCNIEDFSIALSNCISALETLEENINTETETEW